MPTIPVVINTQPIPTTFCVETLQDDWPKLVAYLSGTIDANISVFNYGNTTPSPDNQKWPWFRLNSNGTPDKWYAYTAGSWLSKHPKPPSSGAGELTMYQGSEASLDTYDGGEAGTVTTITGPMWEKLDAFDGRLPVGVGTLAGSADDVATTVGVNEQIGTIQANFKLTQDYMPALQFQLGMEKSVTTEEDTDVQPFGKIRADSGSDVRYIQPNDKQDLVAKTNTIGSTDLITDEVIPPSVGVFFIRRTAREYYRL